MITREIEICPHCGQFDPWRNSALLAGNGERGTGNGYPTNDDTEGTGQELPPLPEERDLEAELEDGENSRRGAETQSAANVPRPKPRAANVPRYRFKFKKGKWRK